MKIFFKGWRGVVKILLLVGLIAATVWLGQNVQRLRAENASLNDTLAKLPETLSAAAAQRTVLAEQQPTLEQLQRLLPRREEVGGVAGALEHEGALRTVVVVITDLRDVEFRDASGAVAAASGPVRDVRIAGVATGSPAQLLSWLAVAEHLPYLMRLEEWKLRVITVPTVLPTLPDQQAGGQASSPPPAEAAAELSFTFFLSIRHAD